ncbi:cobalamin biosynthesis protein [Oceanidesulfovibrio indonesiensis]|uniref:Adenosylcobinamide kinase n=1 Tax=Oceanidesulfovibrio indonesiensis TaxID=54767 RepID=A0A7M3MF68_9BACT|nr:bifunctional adenosylcobinamide kinase/adenosylcobinamide-phosphate guanylyltransferase [Oceanidesulfovibrio indonesiensis]TVM17659.1 cobalamin biosynthesis protein [Oceanidesulfovibrio indonesiensis]
MIALFIGGEKSGKSDLALERFLDLPAPRTLVVTGKAQDFSFRRRIEAHRQDPRRSGAQMRVAEAGIDLAAPLARHAENGVASLLVDSLDYWVFAVLEAEGETGLATRVGELVDTLDSFARAGAPNVVLVSCEVGLGPIAASPEIRAFVRSLGECNRRIAGTCDEATFCAAGLPMQLKTR